MGRLCVGRRIRLVSHVLLLVALLSHASARQPSIAESQAVSVCSTPVAAKSLPPLLFQENWHYERQWIPRIGLKVAESVPTEAATNRAHNASEPLESVLGSRRLLEVERAASMGLSLILVSTSALKGGGAAGSSSSGDASASGVGGGSKLPKSAREAVKELVGLRDGALLSPAEFEAAKRRVLDAVADTAKRDDDDTATRRLSAGVRWRREAFCVVLDDTSGIKSHKGRLTRAATLAAAYCGGRVDLYLLDVRPAMGDDEQLLSQWGVLLQLKAKRVLRHAGLAHPTLAQLELLAKQNAVYGRNNVAPGLDANQGPDAVYAHVLPSPPGNGNAANATQLSAEAAEALIHHVNDLNHAVLLSAPPTSELLGHPTVTRLAAKLAVEPLTLVMRYAVQRGFVQLSSEGVSAAAVAAASLSSDELHATCCSLAKPAAASGDGAAGDDSSSCRAPPALRGFKGCDGPHSASELETIFKSRKVTQNVIDPWVRTPPGAWDPIVLGAPLYRTGHAAALVRELRLAARMEVPLTGRHRLKPLEEYHVRRDGGRSYPHSIMGSRWETTRYESCSWKQCRIGFVEVLPLRAPDEESCKASFPGSLANQSARSGTAPHVPRPDSCDGGFNCFTGCTFNDRYKSLIQTVASGARALIANPPPPSKPKHKWTHPAIYHDEANLINMLVPEKRQYGPLNKAIKTMIDNHISPIVLAYYDPWCQPDRYTYTVAYSTYSPTEDARGFVGAWHYDGGGKGEIKVTIYLQDVDHETACFMIMRHNVTGEPYITSGSRVWGVQTAPVDVPREWLSELFEKGYRPHCVGGPAGTMYMFQQNAIHRASRPKPGNTRLALHIKYLQRKQTPRESGHCDPPLVQPALGTSGAPIRDGSSSSSHRRQTAAASSPRKRRAQIPDQPAAAVAPARQEDCSAWFAALAAAGERKISKRQEKQQGPLDHILKIVFDRIGLANKQAVEFGYNYMKGWASIHGKQLLERYSLNAYTMVKKGWNVTFFDAEVGDAEARIVKAVLTEQNIAGHFRLAGVTVDADFVSVDVDSVDLWLFHGLLKGGYRPRVVAIEFNPNFAAGQLVTFQREWHAWTRRSAFGASAGAVHKVATMFGYTVVQMPSHEKGHDGKMPKYNMDMILVRSDLLTSCLESSIPTFAHLARNLPQRQHPPCDDEDAKRMREFSLSLQGREEEAEKAARKMLASTAYFPHDPVCRLSSR